MCNKEEYGSDVCPSEVYAYRDFVRKHVDPFATVTSDCCVVFQHESEEPEEKGQFVTAKISKEGCEKFITVITEG